MGCPLYFQAGEGEAGSLGFHKDKKINTKIIENNCT